LQSAFLGQSVAESHFFGVLQRKSALHSVSGFEQGLSGPQTGVQKPLSQIQLAQSLIVRHATHVVTPPMPWQ